MFLGFLSPVQKKEKEKKNGTARFFPRPALGWAGLNFFVQKFFILILAPILLSIQFLVVVF